jgi:phosphatidylglycerophosphate synthase
VGEPGPRSTPLSDGPSDWSTRHHGIDPNTVPFLPAWLRLVDTLAAPFVRLRVPPIAITVAGALLAVDALLFASRWPWVALGLVVASVVCDAVDGPAAARLGRVSGQGAVADLIADRVSDTAFALVLWRCGAPLWTAVLAAGAALAVEGLRHAMRRPAVITVAERPTRVVCTVLACASAGVSAASWPAALCAAVWIALHAIGLVQLRRKP